MTIADKIEKDFAERLLKSRSAARHKLVSQAEDSEQLIRSKRPHKDKKQKTVIEEAHPDEVFVAESDGLGGMVGNPEQVQEQILNALNRRPSAFPYQGLVANAMADFEKTAEVLESHNLFSEAEALRKAAADWLTVLQRRRQIKTANVLPTIEQAKPNGDLAPGGDSKPAVQNLNNGMPAGQTPAHGPPLADAQSIVQEANAAANRVAPLEKQYKAAMAMLGKIPGFTKALPWLVKAIDLFALVQVGADAIDKDWTAVNTALAGGAVAVGVGVAAGSAVGAGAIAMAALVGMGLGQLFLDAFYNAWQENIEKDVIDARKGIAEQLSEIAGDSDDDSKKQRAALQAMDGELAKIQSSAAAIRAESGKSPEQINIAQVAAHQVRIQEAAAVLDYQLKVVKETTWFDVDVHYIGNAVEDINTSIEEFSQEMASKAGELQKKIDETKKAIESDAARRAEVIKSIDSGSFSGSEIPGLTPAVQVNNPDHIKKIQEELNSSKIKTKAEVSGNWDSATDKALRDYALMWEGVSPNLAGIVTPEKIKGSSPETIQRLNNLYKDRSAHIAKFMQKPSVKSANK